MMLRPKWAIGSTGPRGLAEIASIGQTIMALNAELRDELLADAEQTHPVSFDAQSPTSPVEPCLSKDSQGDVL